VDIDLLKTFLEVNRTRHFGRAADNLFLTQSAVSSRIRQLEEAVGADLFTRTRNDIQLTPAGSRLLKYAESILNTWNRARQEASLGEANTLSLAIGGMASLWDVLLQSWIQTLPQHFPSLVLQAEAHGRDALVRKLRDGVLDVAFMFEPPQVADLHAREVATIRLMMVSSSPDLGAREAIGDGYVMVDWGTSFAIAHARHFPDMPPPRLRVGLGRMALAFVLERGGATYLAERMVMEHLASGRLHRVADAPVIDHQVYAVWTAGGDRKLLLEQALRLISPPVNASTDLPANATARALA
jgi:LysR family transcriptional regulator, flagellar master operon regulator